VGAVCALVWAIPSGTALAWAVSIVLLVSSAFAMFEARAGWCAVRAMGFKTRV
jgi:hypothetical protein